VNEFIQHLINGVSMGAIYALVALGYTMVYGILQFINFAHADIYMVGAFIAYFTARFFQVGENPHWLWMFVILAISTLGCALLGFLIEKVAYRPLRKSPKLNILITAIGVSLLLENLGQLVFGADPKPFPSLLTESKLLSVGGIDLMSLDVIILAISIISMMGLHYLVYHTKMGKAMRAVSQNSTVAAMLGIHIDRVISFTFIVGSSLAGIAAVLVGMRYPKIEPMMGMLMGTKAFVAAVLGGIGSLPGAALGGLIMGLSEEMVVGYLQSTYRDALSFGILIIILIFKPTGLLGSRKVEKV
jgi:branched-chain amino acid transport system permease protein